MIHTISNGTLTVAAAERGAELQSVRDGQGREYLWQGDERYWTNRAPNIFPYVARLTEGKYYLDGELHEMAIHGIAPYADFRLTERDGTSMTLELTEEGWYDRYPRRFAFRVRYALEGGRLTVTYETENRDERPMYFGVGGHPGFRVPADPALAFEDYRLRFSEPCRPRRVGFTADCFLDGTDAAYPLAEDRLLPLRHDLFDDDAIVLKDMAREVALETAAGQPVLTVAFSDFDYLGIWHRPKTDAPYVCIEPWSSLPSAKGRIAVLEEQEDLICLQPGDIRRMAWSLRFPGAGCQGESVRNF